LWWGNRWNLLTAQRLPIGSSAFVEQYVEVHVDSGRPARIDVPEVTVDNVQLRPPDGSAARYWRDDVPTLTGYGPGQPQRTGGFCLNWVNRYDTWTAGDCGPDRDAGVPAGGRAVMPTPAAPSSPVAPNPPDLGSPGSETTGVVEPSGSAQAVTPSVEPSRGSLLGDLLGE
jgi:hypothetical protein